MIQVGTDIEGVEAAADYSGSDTDGDGILDSEDDFPLDPNRADDTDGDGIPNDDDPDEIMMDCPT